MAPLKFYMTPGSCSTGIHILLEEIGLVFEAYVLNLPRGDHLRPEYLAINPRGTIPTLVLGDGTALTSFQSIARWLAETYPRRKLLPADAAGAERVLVILDLCVNHIHGEGFRRIFVSDRYQSEGADGGSVQDEGRGLVVEAFAMLERLLAETGYVAGAELSIADAALFYVTFWADKTGIALPPKCAAHYALMRTRPAVRQVLAEEGYRI